MKMRILQAWLKKKDLKQITAKGIASTVGMMTVTGQR